MALPSVTGTAVFHLDAALGITKDGSDFVSAWADQVGSDDYAQGTGASQPLWEASPTGFNGNPAVTFDGTDDSLDITNPLALNNLAGATIMVVCRASDAANFVPFAVFGGDSAIHFYTQATKKLTAYAGNSAYNYKTVDLGDNSVINDTTHVICARVGYNGGTLELENLTEELQAESTSFTSSNSGTQTSGSVGKRYSAYHQGSVAEIVVYNSVLSDGDVATLTSYFATKYDITIPATGTGAATVEFDASGTGTVNNPVNGTGAATVEFDAAGSGNVLNPVTGTGAATLSVISYGFGQFIIEVTGTGAATLAINGGLVSNNIPFRYKSRPVFFAEERDKAAELLYANVHCEFNDTLANLITLSTDRQRYKSEVDYATDENVINAQPVAGRPYFRKFIDAVPAPGAFGTYFQVEIDKNVHHINGYEFTGTGFYLVGRPGIDPEFIAGNSTLENGW